MFDATSNSVYWLDETVEADSTLAHMLAEPLEAIQYYKLDMLEMKEGVDWVKLSN